MTKSEFLKLLRDTGRFTESEINLICSTIDYETLPATFVKDFNKPGYLDVLKYKFRQAMEANDGKIIMELASEDLMMILDVKREFLILMDIETFQTCLEYMGPLVMMSLVLRHSQNRIVHTGDDTTLAYRIKHSVRNVGDVVSNIEINDMEKYKIKSTFFFQLNNCSVPEWAFEYAMKLTENKFTCKLESGIELDIPTIV